MWPFVFAGRSADRPAPFHSKLSLAADGVVVLLGAGSSACVGAPLMRGFIDRARDYSKLDLFGGDAAKDVAATIEFYDTLRSRLRITELDLENVENLLSIAELYDVIPNLPFGESIRPNLAISVRRFVEAVLGKAIRLPAPGSPKWIGLGEGPSHKHLVGALAYYGDKITVVTLNYDCVLEYACHCMGIPFTYDRELSAGVEILKLHGSINWLSCQERDCPERGHIRIAALRYAPVASDINTGTVEPEALVCESCASQLRPHIVPPTWMKSLDDTVLQRTWQRGFERLYGAEILAAIGYSLPEADPKLRELLHVGLSSARLREAMVVVGGDEGAAERWNAMFRDSWRNYRLSIRSERFEEMAGPVLFDALSLSDNALKDRNLQILPLDQSPAMNPEARRRLASSLHIQSGGTASGVDWVQVARDWRSGKPAAESTMMCRKLLGEVGFDNWVPSGPILPTHGKS